jgi:hypothetical protein
MYFPTDTISGVPRTRFYAAPVDHEQITDQFEYEDGSKDFNEVGTAPRRWEYDFTLISDTNSDPATLSIFEDFWNAARLSNPFYFTDKYGDTHYPVYIEEYSRTHDAHKPWVMFVKFRLVGYNSSIVTITPPDIDLDTPGVDGTDLEISGDLAEALGSADLQLYLNGAKYGDPEPTNDGAFTFTIPLAGLASGVNSIYAVGINEQGAIGTSNTVTHTHDTVAPSVPSALSLTVISSTRIDGSFTPSTDNVAVTHYRLRRATNSGFSTGVVDTDLGTSTTFSATGLSPSTQYYFKVLAEDAATNQSAYSTAQNATTDAPPPTVVIYDLDLQSYANNDPVGTLTDSSGNGYHATNGSNRPTFKTDDGNYLNFIDGGGAINYLTIPDYTSLIGSEAQLYIVLKVGSSATKIGRFLGEGNNPAAYTEVFSNNLYEPFANTVRKDNKAPTPLLSAGWCVYRVVSRNGFYEMSVNGTVFFTTATNTFDKSHTNPFILGYTANGSNMKVKYVAILNDNTTNLVSALRTRFGI